jgi:hypothetical protein
MTRLGGKQINKKEIALRVLVTKTEQEEIQAAAEQDSRSLSAWVRLAVLEKLKSSSEKARQQDSSQ